MTRTIREVLLSADASSTERSAALDQMVHKYEEKVRKLELKVTALEDDLAEVQSQLDDMEDGVG